MNDVLVVRGGQVYRQALTPEQKKSKRKYLLKQQMETDEIPPFEEVWQHQLNFGDLGEQIEYYAEEYTRVEADDDDVVQWMQQNEIPVPTEPHDTESDEYDEWEEKVDALIEEHREDASQFLSEEKAREYTKHDIEELYDEAVYRIENELDGSPCWRAMAVPEKADPTTHQNLGVYWAYEEDAAVPHWGGQGQDVIYHARIDAKYIDKAGTVYANTSPGTGQVEKEVRFYSGAPLFIYDVLLYQYPRRQSGNEKVLEINDWRTT